MRIQPMAKKKASNRDSYVEVVWTLFVRWLPKPFIGGIYFY